MRPLGTSAQINNHQIIGAPATRAVGSCLLLLLLSTVPSRSVCHIPGLSILSRLGAFVPWLASTAILHVNWAPPPLTHVSPLYRIVVSTPPIHCPSFRTFGWSGQRQSQQTARCQRGQHSLGGPPEQDSLDRPAGDCHVIGIPLSSYTRLSARVAEPRAEEKPTLIPSSVQRLPEPTAHRSQPAGATGAQLTDDPSPARSTDFTASTRTYVATQPAVHSAAREISLAQAVPSSGAPGTGSSEPTPPNDCSLAGD